MKDQSLLLAVLNAGDHRRAERRRFLKFAGGAAVAAGGLSMLAACDDDDNEFGSTPTPTPTASPTPTPSPTPSPTPTPALTDADVLNFALNLEYLEGNYYAAAAFGTTIPDGMKGGTGTPGGVTGGQQVSFSDRVVAQYAREIAADELAHIAFLRNELGSAAVAQPAINIAGDATGAFTAAARAAGVVPADGVFNPYASDVNFLLGAFLLTEVGVTAYQGAAPLLTNATYIEASAGILAAEAYHAGLLRTALFSRGVEARSPANKISEARDLLDGPDDLDQPLILRPGPTPNLVPADANAIIFGRSAGQVLNIAYLNGTAVVGGGFFPNGVNGVINTSAASVAA